ncbi:hypothetical protein D9M71_205290 [compost metagenome]
MQLAEKRQRRPQLQQQGKGPAQGPLLAQTEPEDPRAFHRPCRRRPARIEPQRYRQAGEDHAQGQAGFAQQQRAPNHQPTGKPHINDAQCQGTECSSEFQMLHQHQLQAETRQWRAEQQRAVDVVTLARRPAQQCFATAVCGCIAHLHQSAPGEQQTNGHVHQEKQNQKQLGAPQQFRRVGAQAPGESDAEGAGEADDIQQPPGLEPGDGEDTGVEQGKVAEQRDMAAGAGGGQDGRGESAQCGRGGQPQGILGNGENRRTDRHRHQQAKPRRGIEQRMQAHRGKHRQVHHGDPGTLQDQRVTAVAGPQPPTQPEQPQCCGSHACVAQLNRHHHAFSGIAQQKGQAEEQQHHADAQHGIATEQPGTGATYGAVDEIRATRGTRRLCLASGRLGFPGIGGRTPDFAGRRLDRLEFGRQFPDQFRGCGRGFIKEGFR